MATISRPVWGAGPHRAGVMSTPVRDLFLHHSVTPQWVGAPAARNLQRIARERGFLDISYSWLGDRQGNEIEARGWARQGAHTLGHNSTSHALCLVGNLDVVPLPDGMVRAAVRITRRHARYGPGRITRPHSAVSATTCPGRYARAAIPTINAAASGQPTITPPPPPRGFLMALSDKEQRYIYDRLVRIEKALTLSGDRLGSIHGTDISAANQTARKILAKIPTGNQLQLHGIAAGRFVAAEQAGGAELDLSEVAEFVAQAVVEALPAALADLTPDAIADAVVEALPDQHAQAVVDALADRLIHEGR